MERSEAMPIRGSPNGAHHPRPQGGRDHPEWVVAINRNGWSQSIVTAGRDHPVRARKDPSRYMIPNGVLLRGEIAGFRRSERI
jgi:hypothetical protein